MCTDISAAEGEVLLQTQDLTVKFGGPVALDAVIFNIRRGEILGLTDQRGAGRLRINAIMGGVPPGVRAL